MTYIGRLKRRLEALEKQEVQKRAQKMVVEYLAEQDAKNAELAVLQGKREE